MTLNEFLNVEWSYMNCCPPYNNNPICEVLNDAQRWGSGPPLIITKDRMSKKVVLCCATGYYNKDPIHWG